MTEIKLSFLSFMTALILLNMGFPNFKMIFLLYGVSNFSNDTTSYLVDRAFPQTILFDSLFTDHFLKVSEINFWLDLHSECANPSSSLSLARISLTLSLFIRLYYPSLLAGPPDYIPFFELSCCS